MSVIDLPLSVRQGSILGRATALIRRGAPQIRPALVKLTSRLRQPVLYTGSLSAGCYAAWQVAQPLGWAAISLALLLAEGLTSKPDQDAL